MIYRISIATALLMANASAHPRNELNSEFYNTLATKANAYYNPTVHMNDKEDTTTLHAAQREPATDPFIKYQVYDPVEHKQQHGPPAHVTPHPTVDE